MPTHELPVSGDLLRVMTFNILFRTARNPAGPWNERCPLVTRIIRDWSPDVIGVQEAMEEQVVELKRALPEYGVVIGRRTGRSKFPFWASTLTPALLGGAWAARRFGQGPAARAASSTLLAASGLPVAAAAAGWLASGSALVHGAFCPVFYRRDRLRVIETADVFLSDKLDDPLTFMLGTWIHRVANQVRFERLSDGSQFTLFNVHLDFLPKLSENAVKRLRAFTDEEWDGHPQLLVGDFNADLDSRQCCHLTSPGARSYDPPGFRSLWCDAQSRPGPEVTHHHGLGTENPKARRDDHLMCRPGLRVTEVATITDCEGDLFPSDHFPVVADFYLAPRSDAEPIPEETAGSDVPAGDILSTLP